jgi:hypothetical protein
METGIETGEEGALTVNLLNAEWKRGRRSVETGERKERLP